MEKELGMKTKEAPKEISKPKDFTEPAELYAKLIDSVRRYHPSADILPSRRLIKSQIRRMRGKNENQESLILFILFVWQSFWQNWNWIKKPLSQEFYMMW